MLPVIRLTRSSVSSGPWCHYQQRVVAVVTCYCPMSVWILPPPPTSVALSQTDVKFKIASFVRQVMSSKSLRLPTWLTISTSPHKVLLVPSGFSSWRSVLLYVFRIVLETVYLEPFTDQSTSTVSCTHFKR